MARDSVTFLAIFPEFTPVPVATIDVFLARAEAFLDPATWQTCFDDAVLHYAAHTLSLSQARAAAAVTTANGEVVVASGAGAISGASTDGVSVSYAVPQQATGDNSSDVWFSQTPYGQQYLQIRESCFTTIRLVGSQLRGTFL
ncbi:MAG: DUF4054 domain-containing protein [Rhodobacteraceae bacterium]|nr:DUF4054 domain-containing protein [Paracoccaceae bacterium]